MIAAWPVPRESCHRIPLPLEIADFAGSVDPLVKLVVADDFVLHDGRIDDVVDGAAGEGEDAVERPLAQDVRRLWRISGEMRTLDTQSGQTAHREKLYRESEL